MTIAHRPFTDYDTYVYRQGGKARNSADRLMRHLDRNVRSYTTLFQNARPHLKAGPMLCLGARTGAESIGAERAGFTGSVGVDLHPAGPTVMAADWHSLPFADGTFANAYCNSLDHCLHLDRMAAEVHRVLGTGGRFYVMATNRPGKTVEKWLSIQSNEALYWDSSADLSAAICALGFTEVHSWRKGKWGNHILRVTK
jgi:SAM-dependent methyltransferase